MLLTAHPGAAKEKTKVRQPRLCVHTRSHSLAAVLRRMGGYRCTLLRQGRRQRRWLGRCWWLTLALPRRRTKCARRARTTLCAGYSTICIRALTYSSPRCAVWDAAVALCCGRKGVGCGGWGAAGGIPWRRQDEGRGAHAAPAQPSELRWMHPLCLHACSHCSPPCCAELEEAAAALCCSRESIRGGGDGAAGGLPWRCQGQGQIALTAPAQRTL